MRVTRHHFVSRRTSRPLIAGGALLIALTVSGCSAVNMTGFSMPVFGLTKKSGQDGDPLATSSIASEEGQAGAQSQGLTSHY